MDFEYPEIDLQNRETRLLHPLPINWLGASDGEVELHYELVATSLKEKPGYAALSYVWGTEDVQNYITVNGSKIGVKPKLFAALLSLQTRPRSGEVTPAGANITDTYAETWNTPDPWDIIGFRHHPLWIDALCINQRDMDEKSQHVLMMTDIYRGADKVFMYLGQEGEHTQLSVDFINKYWLLQDLKNLVIPPAHLATGRIEHWRGVDDLCSREYWNRVWTMQELLAANLRSVFICGRFRINIIAFLWFCTTVAQSIDPVFLDNADRDGPRLDSAVNEVALETTAKIEMFLSPVCELRERLLSRSEKMDLLDYLLVSRNRKATDSKDHVYGVLGLANITTLVPNYRHHTVAVFAEATRQLIATTGNLDVLSACDHHDLRQHWSYLDVHYATLIVRNNLGREIAEMFYEKAMEAELNPKYIYLPTWVPSWNQPRIPNLNLLLKDRKYCRFRASGETGTGKFGRRSKPIVQYMATSQLENSHSAKQFFLGRYLERQDHLEREKYEPQREIILTEAFEFYLQMDTRESTALDGRQAIFFRQSSAMCLARVDYMANASFFITEKGYVGRVKSDAEVGDQVCILCGGKVPFVLRRKEILESVMWLLIGECYVEGIMNGEAFEGLKTESKDFEEFNLV